MFFHISIVCFILRITYVYIHFIIYSLFADLKKSYQIIVEVITVFQCEDKSQNGAIVTAVAKNRRKSLIQRKKQ